MSLGEKKCLIKEMEVSKKYLLDVTNTDANIDSVKDYCVTLKPLIAAKNKEIDGIQKDIEAKQEYIDSMKDAEDEIHKNVTSLKNQRNDLSKEIDEVMDERNEKRNTFRDKKMVQLSKSCQSAQEYTIRQDESARSGREGRIQ